MAIIDYQLYKNSNWLSINDYIENTDYVPFISRNRDFTPIAESLEVIISGDVGFKINKYDYIRVLVDYQNILNAFVDEVTYNYDSGTYKVNICSNLMKLQNYLVDSTTLHAKLINSGGDNFKYCVSNGVSIVQVLWLMQQMFITAGLTLDVSEVLNEKACDGYFKYYSEIQAEYADVLYKHFCVKENDLYCINQDTTTINESSVDFNSNKITLWDLFVELCSIFGFNVCLLNYNNYKLFFGSDINVSNDDKYGYSEKEVTVDYTKAYIMTKQGIVNEDGTITQSDTKNDKKTVQIDWYTNLQIYNYGYYSAQYRYESGYLIPRYPSVFNNPDPYLYNPAKYKVIAKLYPSKSYEINTDITTTSQNVVKNFIDIKGRTSIIQIETAL